MFIGSCKTYLPAAVEVLCVRRCVTITSKLSSSPALRAARRSELVPPLCAAVGDGFIETDIIETDSLLQYIVKDPLATAGVIGSSTVS